ncbi:DUF1801 domain-containing protein [Fulvivirgaceae bacterium BMA12]|uniref:DUF1801 domain-containing protein n=1 Tax=Agaribacillus aureus TaxID=3051825 RepID=A0ABT8L074_9BACT|nr:DUF1801 domain-containing protein [Fulvivirgaceae bacterium BMA12]
MSELKTRENDSKVIDFINGIEDGKKRQDCLEVMQIMKEITAREPKMWGGSIIDFGKYHYKYASGREGDWFLTGLSPRKQSLTLYLMSGLENDNQLLARLGKYKTGKACLYIKKLEDVDRDVLREMITRSVESTTRKYPDA